ncbi:MAG TPA: response regulator [Candidatus Glassbacteria bacterium]|nr:response regulator [Candidatus Glassbacteria bacterium]
MRIMVIDDDAALAWCLKEIFTKAGHECVVFLEAREGVAEAKLSHFDVIFTDFRMPDLDGIQVLASIRSTDPQAKVIIMTGYADLDNAIAAVNNGACAYFRKPFDMRKVMEMLNNLEKSIVGARAEKELGSELAKLCLEYMEIEEMMSLKNKT